MEIVVAFGPGDHGQVSKGDADCNFEARETHRRNGQLDECFREQLPSSLCQCCWPFPTFGAGCFPLNLGEPETKKEVITKSNTTPLVLSRGIQTLEALRLYGV